MHRGKVLLNVAYCVVLGYYIILYGVIFVFHMMGRKLILAFVVCGATEVVFGFLPLESLLVVYTYV